MIPHIPILRNGQSYESLDTVEVKDIRTGEVRAVMSIANAGMIRRDALKQDAAFDALQKLTCDELIAISEKAAELFLHGEVPIGTDGGKQSAEDYVQSLGATSGLPHVMVRRNMEKIHYVMANMRKIISGLTRGLDLSALDAGFGEHNGVPVSFFATTKNLGAVLPSNSPGVNSLWLPSIVLKVPITIKPGSEEPWTPWRIIQSFIAAGAPCEAFGFYPTSHEGSNAILEVSDRSLLFGDKKTVDRYAGDPRVEVHGPGWSKVIVGEDVIDEWPKYLEVMINSVIANGGRSCINASTILVPRHGRAIADAIAAEFAGIKPLPQDDPNAKISGFAKPTVAEWVDSKLEDDLKTAGAEDLTAKFRSGPRKVAYEGSTFLLPTIVYCDSIEHPLAKTEFMFPYASVVEVPQNEMLDVIGPTLVGSAITFDDAFTRRLLACPLIERLNLGAIPTSVVEWDQPHEGNLFEFLYRRRAIQRQSN